MRLLKPSWTILLLLSLLLGSSPLCGGLLPLPWTVPGDALGPPVSLPADYSFSTVLFFPPVGEPDVGFLDAVDPALFLMTGNSGGIQNPQLLVFGTGAMGNNLLSLSLDSSQAPVNTATPEPGTVVLAVGCVLCCLGMGSWRSRRRPVEGKGNTTSKDFGNTPGK